MTNNIRKKNSRHRGSWTHGHGEKKKWRGAGSRGGRGNAGSGKRGDAKKPSYWKIENFNGKHGFTNPNRKIVVAATISQLNTNIFSLVEQGFATKHAKKYSINLTALGIDKLIATGNTDFALDIIVAKATENTIKKIEAKGGSVTIEVLEKEQAPKEE